MKKEKEDNFDNHQSDDIKVSACLIGVRNVGKTSLINSLSFGPQKTKKKANSTIGVDIRFIQLDSITLQLLDFGEFEFRQNNEFLNKLNQICSYILVMIDGYDIKELPYLSEFEEDNFTGNKIVIVNKDENDEKLKQNNNQIKKLIAEYNVDTVFYVSPFEEESIEKFKKAFSEYIKEDYQNRMEEIKRKDINNIPGIKYYKRQGRKKAFGCF